MTDILHARSRASAALTQQFSINKPMFFVPPVAGRKITAGFSYIQRIGKSSSIDVWFPDALRRELDALVAEGKKLGPQNFPAQWAAVRQFELLQEAGNYKIYDMDATDLIRTLRDLAHNMRGGGYRVTVASIGSYAETSTGDELEILDRRLQDRISRLTHMLYLEEQSANINAGIDKILAEERWDYRNQLPHIGMTLGARDLFLPPGIASQKTAANFTIPQFPHKIALPAEAQWSADMGVCDARYGQPFCRVAVRPQAGEYAVHGGIYHFAAADAGGDVTLSYLCKAPPKTDKAEKAQRRHNHARLFFDILSLLPQKHIVHDTAVGLQLPESVAEHEWIYVADKDMQLGVFNMMLNDLFEPFGKGPVQHMRGYGDRLTPGTENFYRSAVASLYGANLN